MTDTPSGTPDDIARALAWAGEIISDFVKYGYGAKQSATDLMIARALHALRAELAAERQKREEAEKNFQFMVDRAANQSLNERPSGEAG